MTCSRVLVALRVAAPPDRTFSAFTDEIGEWWQPNALFRFTNRDGGRLAFEPDPPERLVEIGTDGERFEIGPVRVWEPPQIIAASPPGYCRAARKMPIIVYRWRVAATAPFTSQRDPD